MNRLNPDFPLLKGTLLVASALTVMAGATIAPSLPTMQARFVEVAHADLLVRLVLTLPALFVVIGAPLAGLMVDRWGRKPLLVVSLPLYGLAGSSGFFLESLSGILVGRALLGLAVAGIMTSVTTLIADYYTGSARAQFLGLQAAVMGLGGVIALSVAGFLAGIAWNSPFLIYLFAFAVLPFAAQSLYEPGSADPRKGVPAPHATPEDCVCEAYRIRSAFAVGLQDAPAPPMIELTPTRKTGRLDVVRLPLKRLSLIFGTVLLVQVIFFMVPAQLPFYLEDLSNANTLQSGLALASFTLFTAIVALTYGKVRGKMGITSIVVVACGLMGVGYIVAGLAGDYGQVLAGLAIGGTGFGLMMPNLNVWLTSVVPEELRGRALGGFTTFVFLGQFISPLLSQPVSEQIGLGVTYTLAGGVMLLLALVFVVSKGGPLP
jgi:MFS family permease